MSYLANVRCFGYASAEMGTQAPVRPFHKTSPATFKDEGGKGEFSAAFSVIGNVDKDGDRVVSGAFDKALEENPTPPIVWTHRWDVPPIGETLDVGEDKDAGLVTARGRLFSDDHEVARQVYVGLKSGALRQFSWSGMMAPGGWVEVPEGERESDDHVMDIVELAEFWEWGPCLLGANPETSVLSGPKSLSIMLGLTEKATDRLLAQHMASLKAGARNSGSDLERLQTIHDLSVENGAKCVDGDGEEDDDGKAAGRSRPDREAVASLFGAAPRQHQHAHH